MHLHADLSSVELMSFMVLVFFLSLGYNILPAPSSHPLLLMKVIFAVLFSTSESRSPEGWAVS